MSRSQLLAIAATGAIACATVPAMSATVTVNVFDFDFSINLPGQPIVDAQIRVGDTVRWVWVSGVHSVTSVEGDAEDFDSGLTSQVGFEFEHTFNQPGTFWYYCIVHGFDNGNGTAAGMAGTVTVSAAVLGDVDGDGEVTVLDIIAVVNAFGSVPDDAGWNPGADFDGDDEITVLDVVTVVNAFGSGGAAQGA